MTPDQDMKSGPPGTSSAVSGVRSRPILFSGSMVRALLAGTKTQTRRIVKPQPHHGPVGRMVNLGGADWAMDDGDLSGQWRCPCGVPGDLLWVREAHAFPNDQIKLYRATWRDDTAHGFDNVPADESAIRWRPSIHMPRWASRISLRVTDVRVERLQDISEEDCLAEGISRLHEPLHSQVWRGAGEPRSPGLIPHYVGRYRDLWTQINGPDSWDANPWVWAVSFAVVDTADGQDSPGRNP